MPATESFPDSRAIAKAQNACNPVRPQKPLVRGFCKPFDGLEPSTPCVRQWVEIDRGPPYHRDTHSPANRAVEGPEMRRETSRVSVLVCPFCVRDLLSVLKNTQREDVDASDQHPEPQTCPRKFVSDGRSARALPRGAPTRYRISPDQAAVEQQLVVQLGRVVAHRGRFKLGHAAKRVDRPVCSLPLRSVPGRHALAGVGPAATAARAWSRSRS